MLRSLAFASALVIVVATGVVHGTWTHRWVVSHELTDALARIDKIPASFGDWEGRPMPDLDRESIELAEIRGYLARVYRNRLDHREVTVLLVCGRPGPISLHTPDVCYKGAGYEPESDPTDQSIPIGSGSGPVALKAARFRKQSGTGADVLDISWTWTSNGSWEAPDNPRLHYAPEPLLYKLYLIQRVDPTRDQPDDAAGERFLRQFLPELDGALFPAASRGRTSRDS